MPNHFMKLWKRGLALLLAGVLLFSNLSGSLAFAESTLSQETTEATAETAETADTASLSEQAQAFVDAVAALDRDSMVAASNDWGLAHQALQPPVLNWQPSASLTMKWRFRMASRNSMAVLAATRPSLCLPTAPTTTS